ncbi:MAG TPA: hypothetical protein H9972_05585 [Candidatus Paraprevotella stercorigallinarum]|jgi:hypothetical protein|nr:hypothetical protein [Candidatus Paraprevotella stercorigallinarum]
MFRFSVNQVNKCMVPLFLASSSCFDVATSAIRLPLQEAVSLIGYGSVSSKVAGKCEEAFSGYASCSHSLS